MRALVTGASSGIGRDIAIELSQKGYDVILVARDETALQEVKKQIKTTAEIIVMDLSIEENCRQLYKQVGDIDILVNNAGFGAFGKFTDIPLEKEIGMIKVNIVAVHILTKLFLNDMKKRNKGTILTVASIGGFLPGPLMSSYYASKSYVVRLFQGLKEELRKEKSKVRLSILCPGPVDTNFNAVSGCEFKVQSLSSQYVAKYAVSKMLKGKFIIIPGFLIKGIRSISKIFPDSIVSRVTYYVQVGKQK